MKKIYKNSIFLLIIILKGLAAADLSTTDELRNRASTIHAHSVPDLGSFDKVTVTRRLYSTSDLDIAMETQRLRALVEIEKKKHLRAETGFFTNSEFDDMHITFGLITALSALNVCQSFRSLGFLEFAVGIVGLCALSHLTLKLINNISDKHQERLGVRAITNSTQARPLPSFWYQSQHVHYGVLAVLISSTGLLNILDYKRVAYIATLYCFNIMSFLQKDL